MRAPMAHVATRGASLKHERSGREADAFRMFARSESA